tara:strand:- start:137 stop:478 length:342 start_codon:yes stop_codon:yes gene_type:complete
LPTEERKVAKYLLLDFLGFVISRKIYHSSFASIFYDEDSLNSNLKIVVKKKDYSLAVHRNKIKRWVRDIFQKNLLKRGYVVVIRAGFLETGYKDIHNEFNSALKNFLAEEQDI